MNHIERIAQIVKELETVDAAISESIRRLETTIAELESPSNVIHVDFLK